MSMDVDVYSFRMCSLSKLYLLAPLCFKGRAKMYVYASGKGVNDLPNFLWSSGTNLYNLTSCWNATMLLINSSGQYRLQFDSVTGSTLALCFLRVDFQPLIVYISGLLVKFERFCHSFIGHPWALWSAIQIVRAKYTTKMVKLYSVTSAILIAIQLLL